MAAGRWAGQVPSLIQEQASGHGAPTRSAPSIAECGILGSLGVPRLSATLSPPDGPAIPSRKGH